MIAVGTKSKVAVLDLDDNLIRHSLPSHLVTICRERMLCIDYDII